MYFRPFSVRVRIFGYMFDFSATCSRVSLVTSSCQIEAAATSRLFISRLPALLDLLFQHGGSRDGAFAFRKQFCDCHKSPQTGYRHCHRGKMKTILRLQRPLEGRIILVLRQIKMLVSWQTLETFFRCMRHLLVHHFPVHKKRHGHQSAEVDQFPITNRKRRGPTTFFCLADPEQDQVPCKSHKL